MTSMNYVLYTHELPAILCIWATFSLTDMNYTLLMSYGLWSMHVSDMLDYFDVLYSAYELCSLTHAYEWYHVLYSAYELCSLMSDRLYDLHGLHSAYELCILTHAYEWHVRWLTWTSLCLGTMYIDPCIWVTCSMTYVHMKYVFWPMHTITWSMIHAYESMNCKLYDSHVLWPYLTYTVTDWHILSKMWFLHWIFTFFSYFQTAERRIVHQKSPSTGTRFLFLLVLFRLCIFLCCSPFRFLFFDLNFFFYFYLFFFLKW